MNAQELISNLNLQPHPEGGFYKETYRSEQSLLLDRGERNISTAIYYLLENQDRSAFHRIQSDELWFFHQGQPLEIVSIQNGELVSVVLGNDVEKGEIPQAMVPANAWFGARIKGGSGFSLVSCTVSPGFDFSDFELAKREELLHQFPQFKDTIMELTK